MDKPAWFGEDGCVISTTPSVKPVRKYTDVVQFVVRKYPSDEKRILKPRHRVFSSHHVSGRCIRRRHDDCINKSNTCTCRCHSKNVQNLS